MNATRKMNVAPTVEGWLLELRHHQSFQVPISDLSDPYNKAMSTFQAFTNSIIAALEQRDPDVVRLIDEDLLDKFYWGYPVFEYASFRKWVKDSMMKHPHRRLPKAHQFVTVVQLLSSDTPPPIYTTILEAIGSTADFKERVLSPENLIKDPDALYFFRNKHGIEGTDANQDVEDDKTCPVCTNDFDETSCSSQQAPCGHVLCKGCFDHWLLECKGTYSCPLCRACVVCGENDCKYHAIHRDVAPPITMPHVLDRVFPDGAGQVLHGIEPIKYRLLREVTRGHRGLLAWIEQQLRSTAIVADDPVNVRYRKDAEDILGHIKNAVHVVIDADV
jgi:hypothetical protein